jgi:CBS domain containing-hemolysin-like protein
VFSELPKRCGPIGALLGHESYLRMPFVDFQKLQNIIGFVDATPLMRALTNVKSTEKIDKARFICQLA